MSCQRMPYRAETSFLRAKRRLTAKALESINALSGWCSISTVPLQKPRFYAVSGACFCRHLSEYSDNDHFSCMLTIWTYLIATSTTWIFFSITLILQFVIRYFYIFHITNSLMLQFMDKPILRQSPKVNGFHKPDTWSRSFKVMYNKKEHKRSLRSLVRRRNHSPSGFHSITHEL